MKYGIILILIGLVVISSLTGTVYGRSEIITIPETAQHETCLNHDNCLLPSELILCAGARVTWISDFPISLQSGHVVRETEGWDGIGTDDFVADHVPGNQGFDHKFEKNGVYDYFLIPYLHAQGKIIVIDNCNLPPLKQYASGISYDDIQCKDGFELVGKMHYADPACVKPESLEKLVMRGWATADKTLDLTNPISYMIEKNGDSFEIQYSLKGATLEKITHDADANSVHVSLSESVGGHVVISIPRDLIDAKMVNDGDDLFFVLIDGIENMYGEKIIDDARIITIWFSKDAHDIEIIGTFWT